MDTFMDINEDDQVVTTEIPVHLCKELANQLYLFQFPCLSNCGNSMRNVVSSRVKPRSGIIELDCALDTKSLHYDSYFGEQLGCKANDDDKNQLLEKLTLRSQRSVLKKDINCYSIAGLYDGKFCISTLEDSLSFLPTHEHKEKVKKSNSKDVNSDSESCEDDSEEGTSAVPITIKFSHKSNEKTKVSQEQNHYQHLMKAAEEPWCETTFFNSTSSTAMKRMEGLTKTVARNRTPMISLTEKQYLDVLISQGTSDITDSL